MEQSLQKLCQSHLFFVVEGEEVGFSEIRGQTNALE